MWSEAGLQSHTRRAYNHMLLPLIGELAIPAEPSDSLRRSRGVKGYWVSWPGVDTSPTAPTIIYLHGGGLCAGLALYSGGFLHRLSRTFNMRLLTVEYPLCPEASVSEAVAAAVCTYKHLIEDPRKGFVRRGVLRRNDGTARAAVYLATQP